MSVEFLIVACAAAVGGLAGYALARSLGHTHRVRSAAITGAGLLAMAVALSSGAWLWLGGAPARAAAPAAASASDASPTDSGPDVVVPVQTQPAMQRKIARTVTVYGITTAEPGATDIFSVPYEAQVAKVLVTPGQRVDAHTPLVELAPSPDTKLQLTQARNALASARRNLQRVKHQYQQHLATNADLAQARQAQQAAQAKLDSLSSRGAGGAQRLIASESGVVASIGAQPGQVVAPGATLIEVVPSGRIEARLGVSPQDLAQLKRNQPVELTGVYNDSKHPLTGRVRLVTQRVNPQTRLVDVYVTLPAPATVSNHQPSASEDTRADALLLGSFVRGRIMLDTHAALVVPRSAVLPEGDREVLYTVDHHKAVAHDVTTGINADGLVELVQHDGVAPGNAVVATGNAELSDGMAVQTRSNS